MKRIPTLVIALCAPFATAQAQVTLCQSQGMLLKQSPEWCALHGTATVTIGSIQNPTDAEFGKLLQIELSTLGYDPGPLDGSIGPRTIDALKRYQRASGLTADGTITDALIQKMGADLMARANAFVASNKPQEPTKQDATIGSRDAAAAGRVGVNLLAHSGPELKGLGLLLVAAVAGAWQVFRKKKPSPKDSQ